MGASATDPWVALAAVAAASPRLRLIASVIASVIALPRRRPQLVAQGAASLDAWSDGRLVLGIGAGGDPGDFTVFGEAFDAERFARLDCDAQLIDAWLRGSAAQVIGPRPVEAPRPPIWIGGTKPGAIRRAACWDGWIAVATAEDGSELTLGSDDFAGMVARLHDEQAALGRTGEACDVAVFGFSEPDEAEMVQCYAAAGMVSREFVACPGLTGCAPRPHRGWPAPRLTRRPATPVRDGHGGSVGPRPPCQGTRGHRHERARRGSDRGREHARESRVVSRTR